ncbi:MAG: hypothetical protein CSA75_00790 [Sorangium cellulosum]|nr:MAG: hypothetical protein CSA75_00790 [Sorangium cellulosum]
MEPSSPKSVPKPKRPLFLTIALIVGWTFGIGGVMNGCGILRFYQEPNAEVQVAPPAEEGLGAYFAEQQRASEKATADALSANQARMVPLAVANALLSALLIFACARALAAKPGAHILALQAVAANILYAVADFILYSPVREAVVDSMILRPPPGQVENFDPKQLALAATWSFRMFAVAHVITLGFIAYALSRPAVITFFQSDNKKPPNEEI